MKDVSEGETGKWSQRFATDSGRLLQKEMIFEQSCESAASTECDEIKILGSEK